MVGTSSLELHQTIEDDNIIWTRKIPKSVKIASFSYDSSLIASTGWHDRLIKLWRRQSFGSDDTRFGFTYLPHPTAVTAVHWRRPRHHDHISDNVLFSICADAKVRVWAATDPHGLQALQLWAEIDMQESIQPRQLVSKDTSRERYAFIVDSGEFTSASEVAVKAGSLNNGPANHALEHLIEVSQTSPEVCVVLDRQGNMAAWGLENAGCKTRKPTDVFNIAHIENLNLPFLTDIQEEQRNVQFYNFYDKDSEFPFTLLVHHFDGRIEWFGSRLDELFDPSPRRNRLHQEALWTGHDGPVKKIVRNASGKAFMSRTTEDEGIVWKQQSARNTMVLTRSSSFSCHEHIHRISLLDEGQYVANLHHHRLSIWDARGHTAYEAASRDFEVGGKPLCLLLLPDPSDRPGFAYLATITSKMKGIVWGVVFPAKLAAMSAKEQNRPPRITEFSLFDLGSSDELAYVLPVDPAGSSLAASDFLDTFAKDLAISWTNTGVLHAWTATIDVENTAVQWLMTSTVETGIQYPSLASGSSIRKTALVDGSKTRLTIWDSQSGQLECDKSYSAQDTIQDLDWSSTPDNQSILAVGFPYKVRILAQMRYDYQNAGPAWAPIREINIKELNSHPIGDSTWLASGNLVIGAGNQLYVYDEDNSTQDHMVVDLDLPIHDHRSLNIFDVVTYLNGPLPVFHPQMLSQCILAGKLALVQRIVLALHKALKFFVVGDQLDSYVSLTTEDFYSGEDQILASATRKEMHSSYADFVDDEEPQTVTEDLAASLIENLTKLAIPQLSSHDQISLADIVECVSTVEKQRRSMDDNAMRYLLFFRQHMLRKGQARARHTDISWRDIVWAYHSNSQDILVDLTTRQFHGRMLWHHAKESGMFMWMTDINALRAQFEVVARNEYMKTDEKNPIDCSLYYLALKKKTVLIGLWRMAAWNREQAGTQRLLKNDFSEARWKTAALKNAYALLGKRRFEYAAAWFLLAGNLLDAVNVCANQLHDLQLAIAVTRVYDGDDSTVLRSLLEDKVLPQAAMEGDRWLATWAYWMLGRRDMAVRVLIVPVYTLVESPEPPSMHARSYLSSDPALVVLYKQLRQKTLQTLKGASTISPRVEWEFVIQNARLYDRMGCDLLALDLVRNWEFLHQPKDVSTNGAPPDPRKMLRRRSSLVVDDLSSPKSPTEGRVKPSGKPAPTLFEEPTSNSLFDSFGL